MTAKSGVSIAADIAAWPARLVKQHLSLRYKSLLLIVATLLALLTGLLLPLRSIVLDSFLQLEQEAMLTDLQRAAAALETRLASLADASASYAVRDATYNFVQHKNPGYFTSDTIFSIEDVDLLIIADRESRVRYGRLYNLENNTGTELPDLFKDPSLTNGQLFNLPADDAGVNGLVLLPEGPMLVAAHAILTSEGQGPRQGTLIIGRYLDAGLRRALAETTRLNLAILPLADTNAVVAPSGEAESDPPLVKSIDEQTIVGSMLLRDIRNQPALILQIESTRTIYARGQRAVAYITGAFVVTGLAFSLVVLLVLERLVLLRLLKLSKEVRTLGRHGLMEGQVTTQGADELAQLGEDINGMLSAQSYAYQERQRLEAERIQLKEEQFRSREQLFQMAIHDLKTPLTAITGFLDLLSMSSASTSQQSLIAGARRGSDQLLRLVQDMLDVARMEEGRLQLDREPCDLAMFLHDCAAELRVWADQEQKSVTIKLEHPIATVAIDQDLIRRVLLNLISNALKHTPRDTRIVLGAAREGHMLRLWVWDNGPGIPLEQQERIFERFNTAGPRIKGSNSTGLGLTFCSLAARAHGGTLSLQSGRGQGTTFTITLPLCVAEQVGT